MESDGGGIVLLLKKNFTLQAMRRRRARPLFYSIKLRSQKGVDR